MKLSRSIQTACGVALLVIAPAAELRSQRSIDVFAGAGTTVADVEAWVGTRLNDWSQFLFDSHAQAFLLAVGPARLGLEAGHSSFMWYKYNSCPGCVARDSRGNPVYEIPVYGENTVAATRVLAVAQFGSRFFAELAGGVHMFDGYTSWGGYGGLGVRIPLVARLELPVKARGGFILNQNGSMIPVTLSAGLAYRLP
jgi:hypothetical protein